MQGAKLMHLLHHPHLNAYILWCWIPKDQRICAKMLLHQFDNHIVVFNPTKCMSFSCCLCVIIRVIFSDWVGIMSHWWVRNSKGEFCSVGWIRKDVEQILRQPASVGSPVLSITSVAEPVVTTSIDAPTSAPTVWKVWIEWLSHEIRIRILWSCVLRWQVPSCSHSSPVLLAHIFPPELLPRCHLNPCRWPAWSWY